MLPVIALGAAGGALWLLRQMSKEDSNPTPRPPSTSIDPERTPAGRAMRAANGHALIAWDGDTVCMVEDVADPDGRVYRMEYQSTPDGRHAWGWCRSNPWDRRRPHAESREVDSHVNSHGFLCLGTGIHTGSVSQSPYDIAWVIARARFWCTGFSVYAETGEFPN